MEVGLVQRVDIDEEMQQAYLDYAMSVIVARALPDARDGLKPVHRRILYAMYDMGLRPDSGYKKSARIVGEVLGKYHPHGDMAVYEAMARMAQDFSMRYLLVDGQGNFGSVDGDPPAAMRYTEARLHLPATNMLADIGKNTVNFEDNFDGSLKEPTVLPAALPNLLVNGATGIAVGMSTSIPPHNLGEVVDALNFMLDSWDNLDDLSLEDLMQFIQGPDFPTGGMVIIEPGEEGLTNAYGTGRGRVTLQARAHLEEMERGKNRIIVNELPYMTNKASLIERIAELAREEKIDGIVDLRDESDRHGMRIVIELNKSVDPERVLRDLYKYTPMSGTFSIIMLALVEGEPRLLSLKQALRVYLEHRLEIIKRRSQFDLDKARARAHILEGLRVALKNLDEVIQLIRKAPDAETARERLMKRFKLSEIQAQAILDMPLRRLAALERKKIEEEYKEVQAFIKELESLLRSPKKMRGLVAQELTAVKEAYGDSRRTQIIRLKEGESRISLLTARDLTPEKTVWVAVSPEGLIARTPDDKQPRLASKPVPSWLVKTSTRETLYLVNDQGETAAVAVHALPENENLAEGLPLPKVSAFQEGSLLAALFTLPPKDRRVLNGNGAQPSTLAEIRPTSTDGTTIRAEPSTNGSGPAEERYILTVTRQGMVKKSAVADLPGPSASTFTLVKVNEGDALTWAQLSNGKNEILLVTANGMAIRFNEDEVRPMGLVAAGVMGIKLQEGDEISGAELLPKAGQVFLLASNGNAKRVALDQFSLQGRYGQGLLAWKLEKDVHVVGMGVAPANTHVVIHMAKSAPKSIRLDEAPEVSRPAHGKRIVEVKPGDAIVRLLVPLENETLVKKGPLPGSGRTRGGQQTTEKKASRKPSGKPASSKNSPAKEARAKVETKSAGKASSSKGSSARIGSDKAVPGKSSPAQAASEKAASGKGASKRIVSGNASSGKDIPVKRTPTKPASAETTSNQPPSKTGGKRGAKPETPATAKPGASAVSKVKAEGTGTVSAKIRGKAAPSIETSAPSVKPARGGKSSPAAKTTPALATVEGEKVSIRTGRTKPTPSEGSASAVIPPASQTPVSKSKAGSKVREGPASTSKAPAKKTSRTSSPKTAPEKPASPRKQAATPESPPSEEGSKPRRGKKPSK